MHRKELNLSPLGFAVCAVSYSPDGMSLAVGGTEGQCRTTLQACRWVYPGPLGLTRILNSLAGFSALAPAFAFWQSRSWTDFSFFLVLVQDNDASFGCLKTRHLNPT